MRPLRSAGGGGSGGASRFGFAASSLGRAGRFAYLFWIAFAAMLAVLPLVVKGVSCGHDLSFHLENWMEVGSQWGRGTLRPFWCFSAAWGAGEPRFVFYPPASWVLGALLGLVLPWAATPVAFTWVTLVGSGWAMHRLLRGFVPPAIATLGACVYLANPYMLFVAYERTAYAELLAAAWMPLLLLAMFRARVDPLRLGAVVAALWLTNAPAAVVGSYSLLVVGLARCGMEWRSADFEMAGRTALRVTAGYGLGLGLAGFYLVPAVVQRRFVQVEMAVLPGMRPLDNFLFAHTADVAHDAVLRTASWIAVGVLMVAVGCAGLLFMRRTRVRAFASMHDRAMVEAMHSGEQKRVAVVAMGVLTGVVVVLLTPLSGTVWRYAPELTFLQFPWRFLAMEAAVAVALLAFALPAPMRMRTVLIAALMFVLLTSWGADALFRQTCDAEDTVAAQRQRFLNGTGSEPTDEYTPVEADNDALRAGLPLAWLAEKEDGGPSAQGTVGLVTVQGERAGDLHVFVRAVIAPRFLMLRLRQFRGWHAMVDGRERTTASARDDGLFAVPLAAGGEHEVELRYERTWDEWGGSAVSFAALALLLTAAWRRDVAALHVSKGRDVSRRMK